MAYFSKDYTGKSELVLMAELYPEGSEQRESWLWLEKLRLMMIERDEKEKL